MSSINKVTILGNLTRDPEVRTFGNGGRVCNLTVATSEKWKSKDGERQERTEFHRVAIFADGLVGIAERYLRKGSKVYLEGKLETRKWQDQSGQDKYSTEVVLRPFAGEIVLLDRPPQGEPQPSRDDPGRASAPGQGGQPPGGLDDSEIPFAPEWR